jgi:tetratricopeptide (TPR) repeat protein
MQHLSARYCIIALVFGLLSLLPSPNALCEDSPLIQAQKAYQKGNYEDALRLYDLVSGQDRIAAIVGANRIRIMTGDYTEAEEALRQSLVAFPQDETLHSQLAEIFTLTGRSNEALQVFEPLIRGQIAGVRSLVQFAEILRLRGRRSEAEPYFLQAISYYDRGLVFDAEDVAWVAEACRALERFHDANNLFREAVRLDPEKLETHVLWGDLFREKYNVAEARRSYEHVLKQNDKYVPALVGMAQTAGGRASHEFLNSALEINPRSVLALVARADLFSEDNRYDAAVVCLQQALQINPESTDAMALLAAIAFLKDDNETLQGLEKKMATLSPGNGRFYARIAEICGRSYRFDKAVHMAQKAVALDAQHWNGHTILGMNLLRLGKETQGRFHLEEGFRGDPFNVWAMNLLKVLDVLDGFETRTTEHFIVRMHPSDADILWPYLKPLLEECWKKLTAKYDFRPQGPILIEVFSEYEDFAARTSGLPDIGHLLGVCFGSVITLGSPRAHKPPGSINWQEVVWHEFAHVITLQMTKNKIPRWLSEGVSVFEEKSGRPEWGRRQDLELVKAVQEDRMIGLKRLNESFSRAKTLADLNFAYYEASLLVEFIVERYGFETLKTLIYRFSTHTKTSDIFRSVFDVPLEEFERNFFSWINGRVKMLNVYVSQDRHSDLGPFAVQKNDDNLPLLEDQKNVLIETLRKQIEDHPRDVLAHLQLGLILYASKDLEGAINHLTIARDLLPGYSASPNPRQILAAIYEELGDTQAMIRELEALVNVQQHAYNACLKLGQAAQVSNDFSRAVYYLERAIAVNPYDQDVHRSLGAVAMQRSDYTTAIREYAVLLALDETDPALANTDLAEAFLRNGNKFQAKRYALAALEIAPMFERAQDILLDTLDP